MALYRSIAIRLAILGIALTSCAHAQDEAPAAFEEGVASWYGRSFDGLLSASGEVFDSGQFTAAHRTLPFGTKVRVRRVGSQQSIVVRINDRGPFVDSRIIDLSYAAARQLGVVDPGVFRVALEVLGKVEAPLARAYFAVRVGLFRNPDHARRTRDRMQALFGAATIQHIGEFWCVLTGSTGNQTEAQTLAASVRTSDEAFRSAYVVQIGQ